MIEKTHPNAIPPDGVLDEKMTRLFGRSWRTTFGGIVTTGCALVVVADQFIMHPILHAAAGICIAAGLTGAGVALTRAKDAKVSGRSR